MRAEAEHNLILGIASQLASAGPLDPTVLLATVERRGVEGCAFRTPPHKLGLTRMPRGAIPPLVNLVATLYPTLPAVLGPPDEAEELAGLWAARTGVTAVPGLRQGIYQLEAVVPPPPSPGSLRVAGPGDRPVVEEWLAAFAEDTGTMVGDPAATARERVEAGTVFLWDDGRPVAMAACAAKTPHGARVGYVYTPPAQRGRGYATALVAGLSDRLLRSGLRFCCLYTDLSNPVSNRIYQRIGYEWVCDVMDYVFRE